MCDTSISINPKTISIPLSFAALFDENQRIPSPYAHRIQINVSENREYAETDWVRKKEVWHKIIADSFCSVFFFPNINKNQNQTNCNSNKM